MEPPQRRAGGGCSRKFRSSVNKFKKFFFIFSFSILLLENLTELTELTELMYYSKNICTFIYLYVNLSIREILTVEKETEMKPEDMRSKIKLSDLDDMTQEELDNLTIEDHQELRRQREEKAHIKHQAKNTTAQDLRDQVLSHSLKMIEKVQEVIIKGDTALDSDQKEAYDMIWPIITNIISKTEDRKTIAATNTKDIIQAVSKGNMTFEEAERMLLLLRKQQEIDELPKLLEVLYDNE